MSVENAARLVGETAHDAINRQAGYGTGTEGSLLELVSLPSSSTTSSTEEPEYSKSAVEAAKEEEEHLILNDLHDESELSSHLSGLNHLLALDSAGETESLSSPSGSSSSLLEKGSLSQ